LDGLRWNYWGIWGSCGRCCVRREAGSWLPQSCKLRGYV